ncbi:MAG TPA: prolipoprotein diacylglyceryl transferase [Candidatus Peribacteraceae bacterium]|nr:prolipoprotein diacylglyceryl transferase [Candidatus Peribacteraceae bacterium]
MSFFPSRTVALEVLGFAIHWYGVMYLLAFVVALIMLPRIQRERGLLLLREQWASLVSYAVIGVIVGGRLGYVFFYEPGYFSIRPREIFMVWHGGMSSHGGFIGVATALFLYCYRHKLDVRKVADVIAVPVAIGLAFGRFGNFINQELYGIATDLPWGISIPGVEGLRHPTQIYAIAKDLFIAGICFWHLKYVRSVRPGRTFALFLILYGILRFLVEFLRAQDQSLVNLGILHLSYGQLLTLPILFIGALLWIWLGRDLDSTEERG